MDAAIEIITDSDSDSNAVETFNRLTVQPWLPSTDDGEEITTGPLGWLNAAGVQFDEDDDAVRVTISVGSPLGAFTFTVRRLPAEAPDNGGKLIMHVPTPDQPGLHAPLRQLHDGTYLIEGIG